jgi:vancomycin resistance protein YoaR
MLTVILVSLGTTARAEEAAPATTVELQVREAKVVLPLETTRTWIHEAKQPVQLGGPTSDFPWVFPCDDTLQLCLLQSRSAYRYHGMVMGSTLDQPLALAYLKTLQSDTRETPNTPSMEVVGGRVVKFTPKGDGSELDIESALPILEKNLGALMSGGSLALPTRVLRATDSEGGLNTAAQEYVFLAKGTTNFAGSPKNRIYNIKRALEQFQGITIEPGEEFSFVKHLGPVDGDHGYLPELVIKNNQTIPEFGGGICQVSSTMFRAALYSGMKITARKNHAYAVKYYKPYGLDATIYIPKPDLSFVNNTPGKILIWHTIEGSNLTFSLYGVNDGRQVTLDGPHILYTRPDGSMGTNVTQIVKDKIGNTLFTQSFPSTYKSPSLFPHPGQESVLTSKPNGWSKKEWKNYQQTH